MQAGRSAVILWSVHAPLGAAWAMRTILGDGWRWVETNASDGDPVEQLLAIHRATGLPDPPPGDGPSTVLSAPGLEGAVVWVHAPSRLQWTRWQRFLTLFSHLAQGTEAAGRPRLVVSLLATEVQARPKADVCLAVHTWDGWVSGLDMLLYAAHRFASHPAPYRELLAAVSARVAQWDPAVVDSLAELPGSLAVDPVGPLGELARGRGWRVDQGATWEDGTAATVDGRVQVHSGVLALASDQRPLIRRIWSGQAGVLLPLIDERCQELAARVRRWLPLPVTTPSGLIRDAADLEIAALAHLLSQSAEAPQKLVAYAQRLRRLRNALAHLEPVTSSEATAAELYRPPADGF
jgi:hypothetical protein